MTYYLIPGVIVSLAEASGAIAWFNRCHEGLLAAYLQQIPAGFLPPEFTPESLSHQLSQTLLTNLVNSLLLPWGTFAYALLYGDLLAKKEQN